MVSHRRQANINVVIGLVGWSWLLSIYTSTQSPLLFNFAFEYAIRRVQVNQDGLKLNGTHQLLAYADDVNTLGGNAHTVKENAEALVVATKEIGL